MPHSDMCNCDECLGLSELREEVELMRRLSAHNLSRMRQTESKEEILNKLLKPVKLNIKSISPNVSVSQIADEYVRKLGL